MGKSLIITEKPSVAQAFAKELSPTTKGNNGYREGEQYVFTWCVGHLVTMSYPEIYDESLKKWSLEELPFLPENYKYEVIKTVKDQFKVVKTLLNRNDIDTIYYAGDSGREGVYIQMLVRMQAGHNKKAAEKIVWLNSQTADEIRRGVKEAKNVEVYKNLTDSGFMRAIEDYSMGINFSRGLTLKYATTIKNELGMKWEDKMAVAVGRVMTCVLGMIVKREREIREFVETPFYKLIGNADGIKSEWKTYEGSEYLNSPLLYKENGFKSENDAGTLKSKCDAIGVLNTEVVDKKIEKKFAPTLFNLAELQNECTKNFKISPSETLEVAQSLYEKKLTTYPRTDARVLTSAVSKEIDRNIKGLAPMFPEAQPILEKQTYKNLTVKYVDDTKVTDHYAIIPTGQGFESYDKLNDLEKKVYHLISIRFLSIFYPAAEFYKVNITFSCGKERFYTSAKTIKSFGYLALLDYEVNPEERKAAQTLFSLKEGNTYNATFEIKEGKTTPPKRYDSGSIILAMENAGQLIENEELREQIKGNGIGTSATRAEIIKKLNKNGYIQLNKKTQILTPSKMGEMIYEAIDLTIPGMLSPKLTASWEKGLDGIANGKVSIKEYREKLEKYISDKTNTIKCNDITLVLKERCSKINNL